MKPLKLGLSVALSLTLFSSAQAETINLSIAASMTDAAKDLITEFTNSHPNDQLIPNFASSGNLARQIENGAPADIYISANPKWMEYLQDRQLINSASTRTFAYNSLVFIGPEQSTDMTMQDLPNLERIALGNPQSVPAGQYAQTALTAINIYDTLSKGHKLVLAKDVRQALLYADRGEVDGAFVYKTDALIATTAKILFTVNTDLYPRVQYPIALTKDGAKSTVAKDFFDFTASKEAALILKKYGFENK